MGPERLRSEAKNGLDFRVFSDVCRILLGGCIRLYRIRFGRRNFILLWAAFLLAAVVIFAAPVGSFREGGCVYTPRSRIIGKTRCDEVQNQMRLLEG